MGRLTPSVTHCAGEPASKILETKALVSGRVIKGTHRAHCLSNPKEGEGGGRRNVRWGAVPYRDQHGDQLGREAVNRAEGAAENPRKTMVAGPSERNGWSRERGGSGSGGY